jgi:hypothetical protein
MKKVEDSYFDGITSAAEYRAAMERYGKDVVGYQQRIAA